VSDQPSITRSRYLGSGPPANVPVTITSPGAGSTTSGATTTVTGTTTPGATVVVASGQPGSTTNTTTVVATVADAQGQFSASVPTPAGADVITVATTTGAHATGWAQETVTGGG